MAAILPDVFLLSVFRKLSANDRLIASQVCTNWYHRVREVNQALHCLTITVLEFSIEDELFKILIGCLTFDYSPCMKLQLMKEAEAKDGANREELECSTVWNTLQLSNYSTAPPNYTTVQQIISAFPATNELNFFNSSNIPVHDCIVQMLESEHGKHQNSWTKQLKALRLIDMYGAASLPETNKRLLNAINRLPSLKRLVLSIESVDGLHLTDLSLLARLEEISFIQRKDTDLLALLQSLQRYAANNDDLQIDLPAGFGFHLSLNINFSASKRLNEYDFGENGQILLPLSTPLLTVKALELKVYILSHSDLEWLNLPITVPNVQAIHFKYYNCFKCHISFCQYDIPFYLNNITNLQYQKIARECFKATFLQIHSRLSIPLEKITIKLSDESISAKQLLAQ